MMFLYCVHRLFLHDMLFYVCAKCQLQHCSCRNVQSSSFFSSYVSYSKIDHFQLLSSIVALCSWHVVVSMPEGEEEQELNLPHSLRHLGECTLYDVLLMYSLVAMFHQHSAVYLPTLHMNVMLSVLQDGTAEGELSETVCCFDGVFYNYFSIGTFFLDMETSSCIACICLHCLRTYLLISPN